MFYYYFCDVRRIVFLLLTKKLKHRLPSKTINNFILFTIPMKFYAGRLTMHNMRLLNKNDFVKKQIF